MPESVISLKNVSKVYKNGVQALNDVSLDIHKGEIFGLLGPNGAGKTTLINMVTGLARRTSGEVLVLGKDVDRDYRFTRSKIGLVQQELSLEIYISLIDQVKLQAGYYGLRNTTERAEKVLKALSLWEKRDSDAMSLSGGMKRRLMIAKAMVHDPEILFLDEPTAGVDIELRSNLWSMVRELKSRGKTVILTTHYLEEAQELADRIGIINHGRLVLLETKQQLMDRHEGSNLTQIYTKILDEDKQKIQ